ncbi:MAG: L-aspartate oxidase [Candidatus Marinimicrobia bacterium]|nr:L-aspartate oxidase [Candidatus Neomarinimicrobiota bacterium]
MKLPSTKTINTDVLIIGSGLAGCAAALAAAREGLQVTMLSSEKVFTESASYYAQGGIIRIPDEDSLELLMKDFQRAGHNVVNEKAVKQIYKYGKSLVDEVLIDTVKVPFDRDHHQNISLTREASHSIKRIAHVKDHTGSAIQSYFYNTIQNHSNIHILTGVTAVDLITLAHHSMNYSHIYEPSTCSGAYCLFQEEDEIRPILAGVTIVATGGLGRLYLHTSNPKSARGDGYAMVYRAGGRIMNMEYIQFHPTTLLTADEERFLITEAMRGEGGILFNSNGEAFMKNYDAQAELAPRDIVARSIIQEMNKTHSNHVFLDISHKNSDWIKARFPLIYQKCLDKKIDITINPIPVVPAAHYACGGVAVDCQANTTIKRLKAVGEVACTGLHGANRLASSSLLECLVYGTLAGQDAARILKVEKIIIPQVPDWEREREELDADLLRQDMLTIKQTMWNYVGIIRTRKKLNRALDILTRLNQSIEYFYKHTNLDNDLIGLRNAVQTAWMVLHAARLNKESRGCHYRLD